MPNITQEQYDVLKQALESKALSPQDAQRAAMAMAAFEQGNQAPQGQSQSEQATATNAQNIISRQLPEVQEQIAGAVQDVGGAVGGITGVYNAALEFGQSIYDWAGNTFGIEAAQRAADNIEAQQQQNENAAVDFSASLMSRMLGRPVNPAEVTEIAKKGAETGQLLGSLGIGVAGGAATLPVKTGKALMAVAPAEGALWGWLGSDSKAPTSAKRYDERLGAATIGGILGAGTSVVPAFMKGTTNFFAKHIQRARNAAPEFGLENEFPEVMMTLGQVSGDPVIQKVERDAMGAMAQRTLARQGEDVYKAIGNKLGVGSKPISQLGVGLQDDIDNVYTGIQKRIMGMKSEANSRWTSEMGAAKDIAGDSPIYVPFDFGKTVREIEADIGDTFKGDVAYSKSFQRVKEELDSAMQNGGVTVKNLDEWLRTFTRWKSADGGILDNTGQVASDNKALQQVYAGRLAGALKSSMAKAARSQDGTTNARAMGLVEKARKNYQEAQQRIGQMENDFLAALQINPGTPADTLNRLANADPVVVRRAVKQLKRLDGGHIIVDQLKKATVEAAAFAGSQAAKRVPGQAGDLDVTAFVDALGANTQRSAIAGLISPAEEKTAVKGINLMRQILNGQISARQGVVVKNTLPTDLSALAINAISRDPGFLARLTAGALQRGEGMESLFFTQKGLDILKKLRPYKSERFVKTAVGRNIATATIAELLKTGSVKDTMEQQSQ